MTQEDRPARLRRKLPEGIRARPYQDKTGKFVIRYQARAKPEGRQLTKTFDDLDDAVRWRSDQIRIVKLGEYGEKEARRKELGKHTMNNSMIPFYSVATMFTRKRSYKNEMIAIEAFKERAPNLCNIPLSEVEELTDGFQKYIEGRMRYGVKDSTIRRELNPLRHMFKMYGKRFKLHVDPFHDLDIPPEPLGRERWLRPEEDLLLYKAIEEQCRTEKLRLRWLCLVFLALSTALRRGVFLNLKWEDIDWERQTITIKKTYWAGKKKAPDKVPMTFITENTLKMYYQQLSDSEKEPTCKLFPGTESGFNSTWNRIIKRSELSNLHFHDLRHTAVTRYEQLEPIQLSPRECNYLLGKGIGVRTGVEGYSHVEFLNSIRKKLDAADDISRTLDPDISDDSPVQPMMPDAIAYTRAMLRIYKRDQFGNPVTLPLPPMITPKGWLELKAKGIELTPEEPKKEHQWKPGELHIKLSPKG